MEPERRLARRAAALNPQEMETTMNRILVVTDEDETLVLEYVDLEDVRTEKIIPALPSLPFVN